MSPKTIRAARRKLGMTQTEFGKAILYRGSNIGLSVRRLESGKRAVSPQIAALVKILLARREQEIELVPHFPMEIMKLG
jgi:transcriptional regulator with XRE-family HTH domain